MASQSFRVKNSLEVGTGVTITSGGNITAGVVTATSFVGSGSQLTQIVVSTVVGGAISATSLSVTGVSTFDGAVKIRNGYNLNLGDNNDLRIYNDGENSRIQETGSGTFYISGSDINIQQDSTNKNFARFVGGGAAELYYNDSKKFETSGIGITVTGTINSNQINVSGITTTTTLSVGTGGTVITTTVAGLVGVGTTNPQTKLEIDGVLGFTGSNTKIGNVSTGSSITTGSNNNFIGVGAGQSTTTGSDNIFIGQNAGNNNQTGTGNVIIGKDQNAPILNGSSQLVIGSGARAWIYGNSSSNVGIGVTNPSSKLTVAGQFQSTANNSNITGGGQIYLNGGTGNRIDFAGVGTAAPRIKNSILGRSEGTKIVLSPAVNSSDVDYAVGIDTNTLWYSVSSSGQQFKWYAGITTVATLFGTGELVVGSATSTGTASQLLQVTGGAYVSGNLGIGTTNPTSKLQVQGDVLVSGVVTATTYYGDISNTVSGRWVLGASGSSDYTFTGIGFTQTTNDPTLYLKRGEVYEFVNNSGGSHPFQIRVSNGGAAYNNGVTNNGASSGTIIFQVPYNAPNSLYYQCTNHSSMGGDIVILGGGGIWARNSSSFEYSEPNKFKGVIETVSTATTYNSAAGSLVLELDVRQATTYTYTIPTDANIGIVSFKNMSAPTGSANGTTITCIFTQNAAGTGNTTGTTGIGTNCTVIGYENGAAVAGISTRALVGSGTTVSLSATANDRDFVSFFIHYTGDTNTTASSYQVYVTKNGGFRQGNVGV